MDRLYHDEMIEISNWLMDKYPSLYHTIHLETVYKILEFHRGEVWKVKADLEYMFG